jgi:hypothetical protein
LSSFQYKESNPIGEVSKSRVGLTAEMGSYVKIAGGLLVDVFLGYSVCYIESANFKVNIGGLGAGLGLAYGFNRKAAVIGLNRGHAPGTCPRVYNHS